VLINIVLSGDNAVVIARPAFVAPPAEKGHCSAAWAPSCCGSCSRSLPSTC
jgi:hypothetical protein